MKKFKFFVLLVLVMCFTAHSQVQVGFGNITSQSLPINPFYQYSYSQSVYLTNEINASGNITSLQWYFSGTGDLANSQQLVIYLGTTTKNVFASTTDWEPVSNLTMVYSGGITTGSKSGWVTIPITPFAYTGTSNLVVAVEENQLGADTFDDRFYNSPVTGKRSIFHTSNTLNQNPVSPPTATNTAAYVPNVIFGGLTQACVTPTGLSSSAIGTSTATVSWTYSGGHPIGGSDYYYSTSNVAPTSTTEPKGNIDGTSVNLTELNPATKYYFWVRNNCGEGGNSAWSEFTSFVTVCLAVTEFSENFDSTTTPDLPICWSKILRGASISSNARVQTAPVNFNSSPNSLQLNNSTSLGEYDVIAVSPHVSNLGAKTHRLRFFAKGANAIQVGTLDNNTGTAVFNVIETISVLTANYTEFKVDFTNYDGTDQYIGIRLNAPEQSTVSIDNVVWESKPLCPDVTEVKVADVSYNTATIGWTESGPEQLSWDIAVGSETDTDPNLLSFTNTETSGSFLAEGLAPTTKYKAWVRGNCANGKGSYNGPVAFMTTCAPVANFFENFDSIDIPTPPAGGSAISEELPYCWSKIIRANSGELKGTTRIVTSKSSVIMPSDSVNCLVIQNGGSTGDFDLILVSPPVSSLQLKNHRLKFFTKYVGSIEIGTLDSNTNSAIFTLFENVITANGLKEYTIDFSGYNGTDSYIGFRLPNSAGTFGAFTMDNITWEKIPLCPEISNISITGTTTSSAEVSWNPSVTGIEASWDVAWGDTSAINPDLLPSKSVNASLPSTVIIDGLNQGTAYKVWVRAACGEIKGNGLWVGPIVFTTECSPITAFYENFDSVSIPVTSPPTYSTPNLPDCWTKILRGVDLSQNAYVRTTSANTSYFPDFTMPNSVVISPQASGANTDVILVSPNISTLGQPYRLKFNSFYSGTVEIGVLDGNTNSASFTVFKTIDLDYFGGKTIVDFTGYDGPIREYNHIGIRVVPDVQAMPIINIDNIIWEPVPTCPDITTKINVSMTSPTSATIKWEKAGAEMGWQVAVHPSNPDAIDAIHKDVDMMLSPSKLIEGLNPNTIYYVWVRTVCPNNDFGSWCTPTKFVTPCLAIDIPYSENFQTVTTPAIPECTDTSADINKGSYWQTSPSANPYGFNSTNIRCLDSNSATNAWFFTRGVNLIQGTTYRISYLKGTSAPLTGGCDLGNCGPINLTVMFGSSPTIDGMTNTLKDYVGLTGPATSDYTDFIVPSSGVYYFGFYNHSDAKHGDLSVDNILINDASLGNDNFDLSQFNYYPNPVSNVLHISNGENITSVSVYNILGQQVVSNPVSGNFAKIDMSALSNGTYMVKVLIGNYFKTFKVLKL